MIPLVMSAAALLIVLVAVVARGPAPAADEGAAAHLFQLLMAGQAPVVAFFAIKWLPRDPPHALWILGVQLLAAALALLPVALLGL
jgi:hypothetical protein